jgi:Lrp/AsnC family leucine-responsive transcriptional regulator
VRLSPSSCLRRTKALEADGVIAGYRAELDRDRLGLGLTAFVALRIDHSRTATQMVEDALAAIPHVVACHMVTGGADFFAELAVPDLRTYERVLIDDILATGPVRDARSTLSVRTVVDRGLLPLGAWSGAAFLTRPPLGPRSSSARRCRGSRTADGTRVAAPA